MFQLSPETLAGLRAQAELALQDHISFYTITIERDAYGGEIYNSGLIGTFPCYIGRATTSDKQEEIVQRLITAGVIQDKTVRCLLKHDVVVDSSAIAIVSGSNVEWTIATDNYDVSDTFRLHTRLTLERKVGFTAYKDRVGKNKM